MSRLFATLLLVSATCTALVAQPVDPSLLKGLQFRSIGPATMSGRIVDLAVVERDPYTIYVASATGGVWKTTNNGVTFTPIFENEAVHSVGAIAVHPVADSIVWVGTGERANRQSSSWGNGVYRSTDSGETWTHLGLDETRHIGRIALHPSNPDIAFVAGMGHLWGPNPERGLYRTTDGGSSWTAVLQVDENTGVVDVAIDPSDPTVMYAATYQRQRRAFGFHGGGPGSGLFKSSDGGETWTQITEGLPEGDLGRIGISIYRTDPNVVYISVEQGWQYNASTAYGERRAGVYRSDDKGASWTFMSDWNPRPMYASQILVDPSDDQRVYMQNSFSWSDDGGKTFTRARQSLHGDDRILWVNPADSRHVIKGDDGGLGISYDRAKTWLYVTSLPLSQFYRVDVDMRDPYWVYGGLQDNGSWAAPNETYRSEGILNEDWIKTGGGDGFVNRIHPADSDLLYTESQYLGLSVLNLATNERRTIRPGDPTGRIGPRRNWDAWGPGTPEPELGNAMAPANWDGPFVLSAHDTETIYAGTNILWKSTDGGDNWSALGDLTTGTDRRWLTIMDQVPHDSTLSLDDGIPYWPTISAIAESPLSPGLLYAGTDDGLLHVSSDDGSTWTDVTTALDAPEGFWLAGIEASTHVPGRVYVAINNYRNDDYANYLYRSDDAGLSWKSIAGDLPPGRVLRTIREDPRNGEVLYVGAELGLFVSVDAGVHWTELRNGMPTIAAYDLAIHPRDNDLIVATHGRGVYILDNLASIQELAHAIENGVPHVFTPPTARMIRYRGERGHTGDMIFYGDNPARGALIDFYLPSADSAVSVAVLDDRGALLRELDASGAAGVNRITWDFRQSSLEPAPVDTTGGRSPRRLGGPRVNPGRYLIRVTSGDHTSHASIRIEEDPRLAVDMATRTNWTESLTAIGHLFEQVAQAAKDPLQAHWQIQQLKDEHNLHESSVESIAETERLYSELLSRIGSLYGSVDGWTGPLTGDQESRFAYYKEMASRLNERSAELRSRWVPRVNRGLTKADRITLSSD